MCKSVKLTSIVFWVLAISFLTGCGGGGNGSNNDNNNGNNNQQPQRYSVSFNSNGGSSVTTHSLYQGDIIYTSPVTTRTGYDFDGWYTDNTFTNRVSFPYTVTGTTTLYAKWMPATSQAYTVTFATNGGSSIVALTNVTYIPTEPSTSRSGYVFDGWFTTSNFSGNKVTFPYTVTGNITLYAKWTQAASYTVTYMIDGKPWAIVNNVTSINDPNVYERPGLRFDGWYTTSNFSGSRITFPYTVTQNTTLYSKWTPVDSQTYTVTFVTNGGSSIAALIDVTSIPAEPSTSRSGYVFDGWFTASNFSGSRITFPYTVMKDTTLHAKWIQMETFELIYDEIDLYSKLTANLSGNFRLAADISLSTYANWVPIGTESAPFRGKIDGNGYKIKNLKINRPAEIYMGSFGLFGYVESGTMINLALENVDIVGGLYTGAIAGHIINSTITNSYSTGNISSSNSTGGIAGSAGNVTITNSYSTITISAISSAGGIVGYSRHSTITNSYSTGNISSSNSAGGIAGYIDGGTITNNYSTGNISSSDSAGGIAGRVSNSGGTITNSCSAGNVSASSPHVLASMAYAGGIVGDYYGGNGEITNSCSTGDINASSSVSGSSAFAGGIAGRVGSGAITNSFSEGYISASSSSQTGYAGVISATACAGGIVGLVHSSTITNSYSTGNVSVSSYDTSPSSISSSYAGGIAGQAYVNSTITNSYSTGSISASAPSSASSAYAGGIAGDAYGHGFTITDNATINNNIAAGDYAGRIAGNITVDYGYVVVIENNLALDAIVAPGAAKFNSADARLHGVDRSDTQLRTQSTYTNAINGDGLGGLGWKFGNNDDNPWQMPSGGGYPIFYWQK